MKQNRESDQPILNKGTKAIKKSKDSLLINGVDTILYSYATRGTSIYNSHHIPKINSIWIIHLYVNPKIVKLQAVAYLLNHLM